MINRLLEQLDKPRRHLTFLVGLLALVFVLTAVVAWRANAAAHDRARIARSTLDETADMAVKDWSFVYTTLVGNTLTDIAPAFIDTTQDVDALLRSIRVQDICANCDSTQTVPTAFEFHREPRSVESAGVPLDPAVAAEILRRITAGEFENLHPSVRGGLYYVEAEPEPVAALVLIRFEGDRIIRIAGVVVPPATTREMLSTAFAYAGGLQPVLAAGKSVDELFARTAMVGETPILSARASESLYEVPLGPPVLGLRLAVGPVPEAAAHLQFGADPLAERLTILLLMLVIGALLLMAALQVRRDAELSRLRADFVSGVSHELRTPLAQIRMFTETLLLGRVRSDVERRRSLEIIDQEARRLAHLVENVLLFSKTDGGRGARVMPEPTHFAEEVRNAVESFTLLSRNRDVEVRTELQENITVAVDRMALRQILVNLVDNALKYGPAGQRITVGAALFDDVARLWVDDEGAGIPPEERAHVFESFYRMSRDVESRVTGSGIGLAVVRELARLHGGDAWAEAAPGRGARIVVQFPDAYLRSDQTGDFAAAS